MLFSFKINNIYNYLKKCKITRNAKIILSRFKVFHSIKPVDITVVCLIGGGGLCESTKIKSSLSIIAVNTEK
jgi:hypothetical protein